MVVEVNGIVQGVGFRPFIHKLVKDYRLNGWVKNTSTGVVIEVEGHDEMLKKFIDDIKFKSPKLAVIEKVSYEFFDNIKHYKKFEIIESTENDEKFTLISPDVCICDDCLRELFDKKNRRYKYPFINCTNCGPRFTIIKDIPYDRDKTTMNIFKMCDECSKEYTDIEDRRYHAQPNCCYSCGPEVFFINSNGEKVEGDPIKTAQEYIRRGLIIAVKGLGGFHLTCDAKNIQSVKLLRERKHRDEKPFALMCRDIDTVKRWCHLSKEEEEMLKSFRRPIVLLKKKDESFNHVSTDNGYLGVMLPYTPVHYLLMEDQIDTLVMTSANISDKPIIYRNDDALRELNKIADGFLMNNRDIHVRCDDSLIRVFEGREYPIRRSRGYAPFPIKVNQNLGQVLACGGEQKASFALTKGQYAFISQHIGDLKNVETLEHYEKGIRHFEKLFGINPEKIVCDLHPDYLSTEYGIKRGKSDNIDVVYVQHHHAHLASCMGDNNITNEVIGVIWDGTGYGTDGTIWGGEFLVGNFNGFRRAGTIRPIMLAGGDKAAKEIYRVAYALLYDALGEIPNKFKLTENFESIINMINHGVNTPIASSVGRLFDGIAAILGIKYNATYEGQGAIMVEYSACENIDENYSFDIYDSDKMRIFDWRPMIREIIIDMEKGTDVSIISSKFMNTLAKSCYEICLRISQETGIREIVLSGGVFQNMYLLRKIINGLKNKGFKVYTHSRVSTNDEGISLGQALIAAHGGGMKCV
jgi:hydrogenase maturation protein HypF